MLFYAGKGSGVFSAALFDLNCLFLVFLLTTVANKILISLGSIFSSFFEIMSSDTKIAYIATFDNYLTGNITVTKDY